MFYESRVDIDLSHLDWIDYEEEIQYKLFDARIFRLSL